MKIKKFKVDVFEWKVTFIEVTSRKDWKKVFRIQKKFGVSKETIKETKQNIQRGCTDGGLHSWNGFYESLIIIYRHTSKKQRTKVICHEKRHCENRILDHLSIYNNETEACLAGFLSKKLLS